MKYSWFNFLQFSLPDMDENSFFFHDLFFPRNQSPLAKPRQLNTSFCQIHKKNQKTCPYTPIEISIERLKVIFWDRGNISYISKFSLPLSTPFWIFSLFYFATFHIHKNLYTNLFFPFISLPIKLSSFRGKSFILTFFKGNDIRLWFMLLAIRGKWNALIFSSFTEMSRGNLNRIIFCLQRSKEFEFFKGLSPLFLLFIPGLSIVLISSQPFASLN